MTNTSPKFGALVVGSLAGVVGIKYLIGGMLALINDTMVSSVTVADSAVFSLTIGLWLCLLAGAFVNGATWARPVALLTFVAVGAVSFPALRTIDPVIVTETVGMATAGLYLLVRDPIERVESASVDDSESASRIGSTLR